MRINQAVAKTDISGMRFGRWTVGDYIKSGKWACTCDCGSTRTVTTSNLVRQKSLSCGCLANERASVVNKTHGQTGSRSYRIWAHMKARCDRPSNKSYSEYGGRGIKVCTRWQTFANFLADMGDAPEGHSIDRIDNNGNYEPGNCRWATKQTQARNTRSNHMLECGGERLCIAAWAERTGIKKQTISTRIRSGWSVERALNYASC